MFAVVEQGGRPLSENVQSGKFVFEQSQAPPGQTVLYQEHLKLTDMSHMTVFAGYMMPLWYSSISAEHRAVRQAAGAFDCTHMGVFETAGPDAAAFLNIVTTNEINNLKAGRAQYSYILDAEGNVLDDIIVYRRSEDKFMVVVNAANEGKIKAYFQGLLNDEVVIDTSRPEMKLKFRPVIRDVKEPAAGADRRVDIAVQGPVSMQVLFAAGTDAASKKSIEQLGRFELTDAVVGGIDCIVARTGYTGAEMGFELFVHPGKAVRLWRTILERGKPAGVLPCGLGARDSLRIEAGLPLYGHELASEYNISPIEAGYGWAVKLEKKFFIGKAAMIRAAESCIMKQARIEMPGAVGVRPIRQNDAVLDKDGECVGWVLSCAKADDKQMAIAYVGKDQIKVADTVGIYYLARNERQIRQGRRKIVGRGQKLQADITGKVLSRFERF